MARTAGAVGRRRPARLAVVAVAAAVLLATGCGSRSLDSSKVESEISAKLAKDHAPLVVGSTACPSVPAPRAGARFTCTTKVGGATVGVVVTMTDDNGRITFTTRRAVVSRVDVEHDLTERLHAAYDEPGNEMTITATCPGPAVRVLAVGATFSCRVVAGGDALAYEVTVADAAGNVTYRATS